MYSDIYMTRRIPDDNSNSNTGDNLFSHMLWSVRLKATPGRIALLCMLSKEKHPLTVLEIRKKITDLDRSSLFRILESLVKARLIHRINFGSADSLYEMTYGRKHHHHIICNSCGDIEEVESLEKCPVQKVTEYVAGESKKFRVIHNHSLEFFGVCKNCV